MELCCFAKEILAPNCGLDRILYIQGLIQHEKTCLRVFPCRISNSSQEQRIRGMRDASLHDIANV